MGHQTMAPSVDTRERILDTAVQLFQQRGFNGFSYKDIAGPLGIRNAAIHYHYPAKGDLGAAIIEKYRELLHRRTADFMANGGDARVQVEGFFRFSVEEFDHGIPVCPGGAMASEFDALPDPMRRAAARLHRELIEWMTRVMETGREQGSLNFGGDPIDRALLVTTAVQGARQVARYGGREEMLRILDALRRDLGMPELGGG